jgi:hypothetical protein
LHKYALLVENFDFLLEKLPTGKNFASSCFAMKILKLDPQIVKFWIFAVDFSGNK